MAGIGEAGIIALIGVAVSAIGTGVGVATSVQAANEQADAAKKAAEFNNAVAQNSAIAANQAAAYEARQIRRRNLLRLGAQRAIGSKSGIDITAGGSIDDVIFDSAVQGELEANAAEYAGAVQSANYRSRGAMSVFEGRQQANAAGYKGAASLIAGAGSLAQTGAQAYGVYDKYKIPSSPKVAPPSVAGTRY